MAYKNFKTKLNSKKGFYIGDLCYVLADDDYYGDWSNDFEDFEGEHEIRGNRFAVAATMYGDGEYSDNEGQTYGVDAGNIAIVPLELCKTQDEEKLLKLGNVVKVNKIEMEADNGVITIDFGNDRTIVIDTTEEEGEDDEDEEW